MLGTEPGMLELFKIQGNNVPPMSLARPVSLPVDTVFSELDFERSRLSVLWSGDQFQTGKGDQAR